MAHFPRWISDARVDTVAMLLAYRQAAWERPENIQSFGCWGWLSLVIHRDPLEGAGGPYEGARVEDGVFTLEDEPGTVLVVCQGMPGCQRCENQWGGHIFRWFSMVWSKEYEEMRKEGSWAPGLHDKGRHKACTTWDPLRNRCLLYTSPSPRD